MEFKKVFQSTIFLIFLFFVLSILIPKFIIFENLIEFPNNYKLPIAKYITTITKWLIEEASFGIFSFKSLLEL